MKAINVFLLLATSLAAQTTVTLGGQATAQAGVSIPVTVSLSGTGATTIAGVQWATTPPAGMTLTSWSAAGAKWGVYCNSTLCIVVGFTGGVVANTAFADGAVASAVLNIPATVPAGTYTFALSQVMGVDTSGFNVPNTVGASYVLKVLSRCDVNGDGSVNVADVQAIINQALGLAACSLTGQACNVVAVQKVIVSALGGACSL